jgi:hypothetical protein
LLPSVPAKDSPAETNPVTEQAQATKESRPLDEFSPMPESAKFTNPQGPTPSTCQIAWQDRLLGTCKKFRWPLAIAAFALALLASRLSFSDPSIWVEESAALLAGSAGATVIISAILGYVLFRGKKGGWSLCFCALFFVVCAYRSTKMLWVVRGAKATGKHVSNAVEDILGGKDIRLPAPSPLKHGETTPVVAFFNDYVAQLENDFAGMHQEIGACGISNVLSRQTLESVDRMTSAQSQLARAIEVLAKYQRTLDQRIADAERQLAQLDMPANLKQAAWKGWGEKKTWCIEELGKFFAIEKSLLIRTDDLLAYVKSKAGRYSFNGDQILFTSQEDADGYNSLSQKIDEAVQQEAVWKEAIRLEGFRQVKKMNDLTN